MTDQTRREFLQAAGSTAAGLFLLSVAPGCETFSVTSSGAEAPFQFLTPSTTPQWFWYSALGLEPSDAPLLAADDWTLTVQSGGTPAGEITYRKLKALEDDGHAVVLLATMRCIFGAFAGPHSDTKTATGVFKGVPLRLALQDTSISGETSKLRLVAADGYATSLSYDRVQDEEQMPVLLAYELNGRPLSPERGGPVRLIAPEMWAFKSIKWLTTIEATTDFSTFGTLETGDLAGRPEIDNPAQVGLMTLVHQPSTLRAEVAGPDVTLHGMALVGASRIISVELALDGIDYQVAQLWNIDEILADMGHEALLVKRAVQYGTDFPYANVWLPWSHTFRGVGAGVHTVFIRSVSDDGRENIADPDNPYSAAKQITLDLQVT